MSEGHGTSIKRLTRRLAKVAAVPCLAAAILAIGIFSERQFQASSVTASHSEAASSGESEGQIQTAVPVDEIKALPEVADLTLSPAANRALEWLKSQLGKRFIVPGGRSARLIDSYEDGARAGWVYDAALAAIVFAAAGEIELARSLLCGLEALQNTDGSWAFSYDPDTARPLGRDRYTGSSAWVVMAANFFEIETQEEVFAEMARRALGFILRFRQDDSSRATVGAISMGPDKPSVFGVEGNLDCYSALYWRAVLDQDVHYHQIASGIKRFVLETQWAETTMGAGHQYFKTGYRDNSFYLDAQSWTVLAFWDGAGNNRKLREALRSAELKLKTASGQIGDVSGIVGFNESVSSVISDKVWAEGTEGVVAALRLLGESDQAVYYHNQTLRYQSPSGGIPYATRNSDAWPIDPAVASTAWFLLNELDPPINPFNPRDASGGSMPE